MKVTPDGKVSDQHTEKIERIVMDSLNLDEIGNLIYSLVSNTGAVQVRTIDKIMEKIDGVPECNS